MAKNIKVSGKMKVSTLKKDFKEAFGAGIRVYNGKKFADDDATLASIRAKDAKGGDISVVGQTKVGNVENAFKEEMGITIQIENKEGGLADNNVTLGSLSK
jgi:hypothetical protein